MTDPTRSPKLKAWHLARSAAVYVRQSTLQQVAEHQESTARQYALAERAVDLGWPRDRVQVIDDDLGRSGQSAEGRPGFQRLLAEVALDHVGLILGLEVSRLARSCKDWHQLLEACARFRVLLADADGQRWRRSSGSGRRWPGSGSCVGSGRGMRPSGRRGSTRRVSRRTGWWPASWSAAGRRPSSSSGSWESSTSAGSVRRRRG